MSKKKYTIELTESQTKEINDIVKEYGYIPKIIVKGLESKHNFETQRFKNTLKQLDIPFVCCRLDYLFNPFNIKRENDKTILLSDFIKLPEWRKDVFKWSTIKTKFNCKNVIKKPV